MASSGIDRALVKATCPSGDPREAVSNPVRSGKRQVRVIQAQLALHPGNSGGRLYDTAGRLIGINTWASERHSGEGYGFSIGDDYVPKRQYPKPISWRSRPLGLGSSRQAAGRSHQLLARRFRFCGGLNRESAIADGARCEARKSTYLENFGRVSVWEERSVGTHLSSGRGWTRSVRVRGFRVLRCARKCPSSALRAPSPRGRRQSEPRPKYWKIPAQLETSRDGHRNPLTDSVGRFGAKIITSV